MHIKSLELQGFKSYNRQDGVVSFSPGQNVIVGRNGSGKSNFFRAIQFVLGDKSFSSTSHKERMELLHEGSGSPVMSAHVEMVFDNSDRRFPVDSDEVALRRTIGLKKDEYFVNGKHVTKSDVSNLLESAGFSRSNPYYIVQQGKVNSLCLMRDEQRLELLKEIAGTNVYEERRKNSEAILAETRKKRDKIHEYVQYIEERLDELKDEKEELEMFRALDRKKRALEYTLYDLEMQNAVRTLEGLEEDREEASQKTEELSASLNKLSDQRANMQSKLKLVQKALRRTEQESELVEKDCAGLVKNKTTWELKFREMEEREKSMMEQAKHYEKALADVDERIAAKLKELTEVAKPAHENAKKAVRETKEKIRTLERRRFELESKQGRKLQFQNQAERDAWLDKEIESVEQALQLKRKSEAQFSTSLKDRESAREHNRITTKELEEQVAECNTMAKKDRDELRQLKEQRAQATEEQKALWRKQEDLKRDMHDANEELSKAEKILKSSMPPATMQGLDALKTIAADLGMTSAQIHGPLFELIYPESEVFETAVEVSVSNSMTHVVVDNDETAATLMRELQRRKAGRVTFKPLEQIAALRDSQRGRNLNDDSVDHDIIGLDDSDTSQEFLPLISKVRYPPAVKHAVRQVLGKVLLCRTPEIASQKRKELHVNCVTLQGEEVNRSGALKGGFYDSRKSKLRAAAMIRQAKARLEKLEEEDKKTASAISQMEKRSTKLFSNIKDVEARLERSKSLLTALTEEIAQKKTQGKEMDNQLESEALSLEECSKGIEELEQQKNKYQDEKQTPMLDKLSQEEQEELAGIRSSMVVYKQELSQATELAHSASQRVNNLDTELESNLKLQRTEILKNMGRAPVTQQQITAQLDDEETTSKQKKSTAKTKASKSKAKRKQTKAQGKTKKTRTSRSSSLSSLEDEEEEEEEEEVREEELEEDRLASRFDLQTLEGITAYKDECKVELDKMEKRLRETRAQHEELETEAGRLREEVRELRSELERLEGREKDLTEELQGTEEILDKILNKRSVQLSKREDAARKVRELGSLSTEELDKVSSFRSLKVLLEEIKRVNAELQKYSHVNKKALDQFISFSDRREALLKRKEELDEGEASILDLMRHLDTQKDEDILRTFRGVAKHFKEVFKELVPQGEGELVMCRRSAGDGGSGDLNSVEEFVGVSPRVSFTGKDERFHMRQLSGGQKALVALTLVFAIQRLDDGCANSFVIMDEIDAPLDTSYRTSLAALIQRQSKKTQFILTTFRPELVQNADQCFGIQFQNKVSSVVKLDNRAGLKFVKTIAAHEGSSNETSTKGSGKRKSSASATASRNESEDDDEEEEQDSSDSSESQVVRPKKQRRTTGTRVQP